MLCDSIRHDTRGIIYLNPSLSTGCEINMIDADDRSTNQLEMGKFGSGAYRDRHRVGHGNCGVAATFCKKLIYFRGGI